MWLRFGEIASCNRPACSGSPRCWPESRRPRSFPGRRRPIPASLLRRRREGRRSHDPLVRRRDLRCHPAAVSAAVQARRMGKTAGVFVFRRHVGGMSSSGLSHADFGKNEAIGGIARSVFLECWKDRVQSPAAVETLFLTILTEANVPVFFKHRLHGTARRTSGINPSASGWMPPSQSRCRGPSPRGIDPSDTSCCGDTRTPPRTPSSGISSTRVARSS